MTELEQIILESAEVLRSSVFGQRLQEYYPGRRGSRGSPTENSLLVSQELGLGPAIRRTNDALIELRAMGEELANLPAPEHEYLEWIHQLQPAARRLSAKCWNPIPQSIRGLPVDEDDFAQFIPRFSPYISNLRTDELGDAFSLDDLAEAKHLAALSQVWQAVRETELHQTTAHNCRDASRTVLEALEATRRDFSAWVRSLDAVTFGQLHTDARAYLADVLANESEQVHAIAGPIRRLNRLIQMTVGGLLSLVESLLPVRPIIEVVGPIRGRLGENGLRIRLTESAEDSHITLPTAGLVPVAMGTPVDGLYQIHSTHMEWSGTMLATFEGERLADLESEATAAWP